MQAGFSSTKIIPIKLLKICYGTGFMVYFDESSIVYPDPEVDSTLLYHNNITFYNNQSSGNRRKLKASF